VAKFMFIYRGNPEGMAHLTPDEMQQHMGKWGQWIGEAVQKGWMVDPGDALTGEGRVVNAKVVTDGPFVESKEVVGGYSVVEAESVEAAAKLAKGCPGISFGGRVEVRRLAGYTVPPK
jgi:hypothetical protein